MKLLLIGEYKENKFFDAAYDLFAFAEKMNAEKVMFAVGSDSDIPKFKGKLYLSDSEKFSEYAPDLHKKLIHKVIEKENPDYIVFLHSSYGWDLAPRIAASSKISVISEVVDAADGIFVRPICNSKLRVNIKSSTEKSVLTVQSGAFGYDINDGDQPEVEKIDTDDVDSKYIFKEYEEAADTGVDLSKAEIIVSVGRGIGKKDNLATIEALAKTIGAELGASRPVVDAEWLDASRQVGMSGQTVAPKLYISCGISGSIQHLAGMKKSEYIVAINTDKDAPIGDEADVLVISDVNQFVPALTKRLQK